MSRGNGSIRRHVWVWDDGQIRRRRDAVAIEEPLEIRLQAGGVMQPLMTTMRTPGADFELAAGFLLAEGLVSAREQIGSIRYCVDGEQLYNTLTVDLRLPQLPPLAHLERRFVIGSACGVCGRAALDDLVVRGLTPLAPTAPLDPQTLTLLPDRLREAQAGFAATGGVHAAALFDRGGNLMTLREDVGRHNAVDKLVGWALLNRQMPLHHTIMLVSGRPSYEIVQKALVAGIPIVAAVSAPSSLAVQLAQQFSITLVGFLRGRRFNIYSAAHRLGLE
ncbi:MAG: formate dehydrogenase accessory sulfurtransferase FdhD [Oscillochloris sp.]|nr:formate dehydrogenase accessory sulfurtransferase FdhD [Oscillochloris sp.]